MAQKTIKLNPDFLSLNGRKSENKSTKTKKVRPTSIVKPNKLRKELLTRIKNHQHKADVETKTKNNLDKKESNDIFKFDDDFTKSMDYLEELSKNKIIEKNKQKNMKKTRKHMNNNQQSAPIIVNTSLPDEMKASNIKDITNNINPINTNVSIPNLINETVSLVNDTIMPTIIPGSMPLPILTNQPTYSCLKNGTRPTYKQLFTRKAGFTQNEQPKPITIENIQTPPIAIPERKEKLKLLKKKYKKEIKPVRQKKSKTIRFNLGKKDNNVSVLIKNNDTRRKIKKAHGDLKKNNILDIKKYLKEHNLLKVGSEAPNDVLRQLYEQSRLTGEINNSNSNNLIHNYLSK